MKFCSEVLKFSETTKGCDSHPSPTQNLPYQFTGNFNVKTMEFQTDLAGILNENASNACTQDNNILQNASSNSAISMQCHWYLPPHLPFSATQRIGLRVIIYIQRERERENRERRGWGGDGVEIEGWCHKHSINHPRVPNNAYIIFPFSLPLYIRRPFSVAMSPVLYVIDYRTPS